MSEDAVERLAQWTRTQLQARGWPGAGDKLQALSGDAGFRTYYRVATVPPLIAVHAPPATESASVFVSLARYLRDQGIHTPEVLAFDAEQGFLLLEDLGSRHLLDELTTATVDTLYAEAMMVLLRLQQVAPPTDLPAYDRPLLRREMALFSEWFVPQLLGHSLSDAELTLLDDVFTVLEDSALDQPQVLVHRDFHSRNLMVRDGAAPGVIDFQDAVRGPVTYDLVSVLRDCYVRWPDAKVERWAVTYADMAVDVGIMDAVCEHTFMRWFDLMGLQRHIKVLGIFARLWLRDGKSAYLNDLPLVLRYTLEVARKYPEFAAFAAWFETVLLPLAASQSWYSDYRRAGAPRMEMGA